MMIENALLMLCTVCVRRTPTVNYTNLHNLEGGGILTGHQNFVFFIRFME